MSGAVWTESGVRIPALFFLPPLPCPPSRSHNPSHTPKPTPDTATLSFLSATELSMSFIAKRGSKACTGLKQLLSSTLPHLRSPNSIRTIGGRGDWSDRDTRRPRNRDRDRDRDHSSFQDRPSRGGDRPRRSPFSAFNLNERNPPLNRVRPNLDEDDSITENQSPPLKVDGVGETFLEKFKLGFGGKDTQNSQQKSSPPTDEVPPTREQTPPQDSDEIFKKMKETGLIPNAVAMLDGLCKDGLVQEAMKLFGLMREKGTIPEVVIYTAVVEGFCKAHKFDDAKRVFKKMVDTEITPNAFSYTVLIQGLCKGGRFEDAVEFSVEMLEAGHSPNVATLTSLIDGVCCDKGVEEAGSIIKKLKEKGYFVNDKAVRDHLNKKGPFSPLVWEAIFGKKASQKLF